MLGTKYNNTTTGKIDGWLRTTINGNKNDAGEDANQLKEKDANENTQSSCNARIKIMGLDAGKPKNG